MRIIIFNLKKNVNESNPKQKFGFKSVYFFEIWKNFCFIE